MLPEVLLGQPLHGARLLPEVLLPRGDGQLPEVLPLRGAQLPLEELAMRGDGLLLLDHLPLPDAHLVPGELLLRGALPEVLLGQPLLEDPALCGNGALLVDMLHRSDGQLLADLALRGDGPLPADLALRRARPLPGDHALPEDQPAPDGRALRGAASADADPPPLRQPAQVGVPATAMPNCFLLPALVACTQLLCDERSPCYYKTRNVAALRCA